MKFMSTFSLLSLTWAAVLILSATPTVVADEKDRLKQFYAHNHTWPIEKFVPETPGWRKLFEHRLRQVAEIETRAERFEGFAQTLSAGVVQPNFTEWGFGLARAPEPLMEDLRKAIREGLEKGPRLENDIKAITKPRPWFIDRPDLTKRVMEELHEYPEKWAGLPLTAHQAYGFRLYRNESRLHVHVDRSATHVISFILHIDSSDDAEPWPILIEDFQGTTHEVVLTSGDILFYESSKCFHGRPRPLKGSWYSSVFVHYHPKYDYKENFDKDSKVWAIPPGWDAQPTTRYEIPIEMHGTTMEEPMCPNNWCSTEKSKKWSGPAVEGLVTDPDGQKRVLMPELVDLSQIDCDDDEAKCKEWAAWESNECERNAKFMKKNCKKSCGVCDSILADLKAKLHEEL